MSLATLKMDLLGHHVRPSLLLIAWSLEFRCQAKEIDFNCGFLYIYSRTLNSQIWDKVTVGYVVMRIWNCSTRDFNYISALI
jgi:hypothetical protein